MSDTFDHALDAYESMERAYDEGEDTPPDNNITCKFCGKHGFHFKKTKNGKWWLADANEIWHDCKGIARMKKNER